MVARWHVDRLNDPLTSTPPSDRWLPSGRSQQETIKGLGSAATLWTTDDLLSISYWRSGPSVCIARQICICEYSTKRVLDLKTGVQVESNAEVKNAITVSYSWHFFVWHATGDLLSIDFRVIYIYTLWRKFVTAFYDHNLYTLGHAFGHF